MLKKDPWLLCQMRRYTSSCSSATSQLCLKLAENHYCPLLFSIEREWMGSLMAPMRFCMFLELFIGVTFYSPLKTLSHSDWEELHALNLWFVNSIRLINICHKHIKYDFHKYPCDLNVISYQQIHICIQIKALLIDSNKKNWTSNKKSMSW